MNTNVRLAVRAVIVERGQLLLVNAWPGAQSDLWCAPGGGVEPGADLPANLRREVLEETGLRIVVGAPCLVKEFHDPSAGFHQVDIYFRARLDGADAEVPGWRDPAGVVDRRVWVDATAMKDMRVKPDILAVVAFGGGEGLIYDPLERMTR
jgi:8-oxo-dGTP diphosphatase